MLPSGDADVDGQGQAAGDTSAPAAEQPNNPLHGVTLKAMLEELIDRYGFEELGARIQIRCFTHDPSLSSSLKFLRRTKWARQLVEELFLQQRRAQR